LIKARKAVEGLKEDVIRLRRRLHSNPERGLEEYETSRILREYFEGLGLSQISDEKVLTEVIKRVMDKNPKSVEDYRSGATKAMGFLVGQTMKETRGKANPALVNKILKQLLDE
jgi:aspartyl-tRNA(Asn)/glutamyl-tRNA(Gln) amidotransferase subunit B